MVYKNYINSRNVYVYQSDMSFMPMPVGCGSHLICEPPFACVQIIVSLVISAGGQERPGHCTSQPPTLAGQRLTMMSTVAVAK